MTKKKKPDIVKYKVVVEFIQETSPYDFPNKHSLRSIGKTIQKELQNYGVLCESLKYAKRDGEIKIKSVKLI